MKHSILLLLMPVLLYPQAKIDTVNQTIYLREVREIDLPAKELKDKAFDWVAKAYNNSNYVVRVNEDDRVIAKGSYQVSAVYKTGKYSIPRSANIGYTLDLEFKDGRYKVEINQLEDIGESVRFHLMPFDGFKAQQIRMANDYDGPGKKGLMKATMNDKKVMADYVSHKDVATTMVNQTLDHITKLEANLHAFMLAEQNDDW